MHGSELVSAFLEHSPFVGHLGIELRSIEDDHAVLVLPFSEEVVTIGDLVHGGAVAALIDTAAATSCYSGVEFEGAPQPGATVGLTVDYLAAARAQALVADARVLRRGSNLCFCEVKVSGDADDALVATGLVTYKLG